MGSTENRKKALIRQAGIPRLLYLQDLKRDRSSVQFSTGGPVQFSTSIYKCGFSKEETMPTDACQFFYPCTRCGTIMTSKPWDCCVFCSYGNVKCPPVQESGSCGCCG